MLLKYRLMHLVHRHYSKVRSHEIDNSGLAKTDVILTAQAPSIAKGRESQFVQTMSLCRGV